MPPVLKPLLIFILVTVVCLPPHLARAEKGTLSYSLFISEAAKAKPDDFEFYYQQAVKLKQSDNQFDRTQSRIAVRRDVATQLAAESKWLEAISQLGHAISLAQSAERAQDLASLTAQKAHYSLNANHREAAYENALLAWNISSQINASDIQIKAGLIICKLLYLQGQAAQATSYYDAMLNLPKLDRLSIEHHRARHLSHLDAEARANLWQQVRNLADQSENTIIQAEALDSLAHLAVSHLDFQSARQYFLESDRIAPDRIRLPHHWKAFITAFETNEKNEAHSAVIKRGLLRIDEEKDPEIAADFLEALATQLATDHDYEAAYRTTMRARELQKQSRAIPQSVPMVKMSAPTSNTETEQAAALAAVQNALREAELTSAQLRKSVAYLASATLLLLAFALATAYHFKRKAAAALATARDAAELRADRTHWQMLRYQLSPHFLFNALSSLSGLIITKPESARRVVERLSVFCRLALDHSTDKHRTLDEELELLSAYLDVEKAGAGDSLLLSFDIRPETRTRQIPPLLLQPLVENALKYGGQTAEDKLEISISSRLDNDELVIVIANTGHWLEPNYTPSKRQRVGLNNVRERLAKIGAPEPALTHDSHQGWVRLTLRIPHLNSPEI